MAAYLENTALAGGYFNAVWDDIATMDFDGDTWVEMRMRVPAACDFTVNLEGKFGSQRVPSLLVCDSGAWTLTNGSTTVPVTPIIGTPFTLRVGPTIVKCGDAEITSVYIGTGTGYFDCFGAGPGGFYLYSLMTDSAETLWAATLAGWTDYGSDPHTFALGADEEPLSYDFTDPDVKLALTNPGIIGVELGFIYSSGTYESVEITRQAFKEVKVSDDDLYVTFEGESFVTRLDKALFYGGRYDVSGIAASTLFAEVLEDVEFPDEGGWAYRLGDANCKVSNTQPLWQRTGYAYYHIDAAFDSILVNLPIPVVSHREALTMLAAYTGAYLKHRSDGSLDVVPSLGAQLDYHLDIDRIYDRPEMVNGANIARIQGTLGSYDVAADPETILDTTIAVPDTDPATFRIIHDACADGSLVLTGATLIGDPTYNTYSTVFEATPGSTTFGATLTGKRVTINTTQFAKDYPSIRGDTVEFTNPIASDLVLAEAMYDRYWDMATALTYKFTMRDDPAVEVGDRAWLDTLSEPTGIPIIVTEIKRAFDGGTTGDYTVIEDPEGEAVS